MAEVGITFSGDSFAAFNRILREFRTVAEGVDTRLDRIAKSLDRIDTATSGKAVKPLIELANAMGNLKRAVEGFTNFEGFRNFARRVNSVVSVLTRLRDETATIIPELVELSKSIQILASALNLLGKVGNPFKELRQELQRLEPQARKVNSVINSLLTKSLDARKGRSLAQRFVDAFLLPFRQLRNINTLFTNAFVGVRNTITTAATSSARLFGNAFQNTLVTTMRTAATVAIRIFNLTIVSNLRLAAGILRGAFNTMFAVSTTVARTVAQTAGRIFVFTLRTAILAGVATMRGAFTTLFSTLTQGIPNAIRNVGASIEGLGRSVRGFGTQFSLFVSTPIAGLLGGSVREAVTFESAFAGVIKTLNTTGLTAEETQIFIKDLELGIRELATAPDSVVAGLDNAQSTLARIAELAGQLGIARENILGFTEVIAQLTIATDLTAEAAATNIAQFANIFQSTAFDRIGASIVALGNNSATTESQIVEFAQRLAGAGRVAGLTESNVLAIGAAMASVGLNAEAGGSAFTQFLNAMTNSIAKGTSELGGFARLADRTSAEFAETFRNRPVEAIEAVIQGLSRLDAEAQVVALDQLGLDGLRVADTLRRLASNTELLTGSIELSNQAWEENSALQEEAQRRFETTEAQINLLQNNIRELAITIGNVLLPAINRRIEFLVRLVRQIAALDPAILKLAATIGTLLAALGPILVIGGQILIWVGSIISAFGALAGIILSPVGLVVGIGLLIDKVIDLSGPIRFISDQISDLVRIAGDAVNAIVQIINVATPLTGLFNIGGLGAGGGTDQASLARERQMQAVANRRLAIEQQIAELQAETSAQFKEVTVDFGDTISGLLLRNGLAANIDNIRRTLEGTLNIDLSEASNDEIFRLARDFQPGDVIKLPVETEGIQEATEQIQALQDELAALNEQDITIDIGQDEQGNTPIDNFQQRFDEFSRSPAFDAIFGSSRNLGNLSRAFALISSIKTNIDNISSASDDAVTALSRIGGGEVLAGLTDLKNALVDIVTNTADIAGTIGTILFGRRPVFEETPGGELTFQTDTEASFVATAIRDNITADIEAIDFSSVGEALIKRIADGVKAAFSVFGGGSDPIATEVATGVQGSLRTGFAGFVDDTELIPAITGAFSEFRTGIGTALDEQFAGFNLLNEIMSRILPGGGADISNVDLSTGEVLAPNFDTSGGGFADAILIRIGDELSQVDTSALGTSFANFFTNKVIPVAVDAAKLAFQIAVFGIPAIIVTAIAGELSGEGEGVGGGVDTAREQIRVAITNFINSVFQGFGLETPESASAFGIAQAIVPLIVAEFRSMDLTPIAAAVKENAGLILGVIAGVFLTFFAPQFILPISIAGIILNALKIDLSTLADVDINTLAAGFITLINGLADGLREAFETLRKIAPEKLVIVQGIEELFNSIKNVTEQVSLQDIQNIVLTIVILVGGLGILIDFVVGSAIEAAAASLDDFALAIVNFSKAVTAAVLEGNLEKATTSLRNSLGNVLTGFQEAGSEPLQNLGISERLSDAISGVITAGFAIGLFNKAVPKITSLFTRFASVARGGLIKAFFSFLGPTGAVALGAFIFGWIDETLEDVRERIDGDEGIGQKIAAIVFSIGTGFITEFGDAGILVTGAIDSILGTSFRDGFQIIINIVEVSLTSPFRAAIARFVDLFIIDIQIMFERVKGVIINSFNDIIETIIGNIVFISDIPLLGDAIDEVLGFDLDEAISNLDFAGNADRTSEIFKLQFKRFLIESNIPTAFTDALDSLQRGEISIFDFIELTGGTENLPATLDALVRGSSDEFGNVIKTDFVDRLIQNLESGTASARRADISGLFNSIQFTFQERVSDTRVIPQEQIDAFLVAQISALQQRFSEAAATGETLNVDLSSLMNSINFVVGAIEAGTLQFTDENVREFLRLATTQLATQIEQTATTGEPIPVEVSQLIENLRLVAGDGPFTADGAISDEQINTAVESLMTSFSTAVENKISETPSSELDAAQLFGVNISGVVTPEETAQLNEVGGSVVSGIVDGINTSKPDVITAAQTMFTEMIDGSRQILEAESPSQVFYVIGQDVIAGMVAALDEDTTLLDSVTSLIQRSILDQTNLMLELGPPSAWAIRVGQTIPSGLATGIRLEIPTLQLAVNDLLTVFTTFATTLTTTMTNLQNDIMGSLLGIASTVGSVAESLRNLQTEFGGGVSVGVSSATAANIPAFAGGGILKPNEISVVGEEGPEMIVSPSLAGILNANSTRAYLAGFKAALTASRTSVTLNRPTFEGLSDNNRISLNDGQNFGTEFFRGIMSDFSSGQRASENNNHVVIAPAISIEVNEAGQAVDLEELRRVTEEAVDNSVNNGSLTRRLLTHGSF